jgi:hypothetical protein
VTIALLAASWRAVRISGAPVVMCAALVLLAVLYPSLDSGHGLTVLRGTAVLLAAGLLLTLDDPSGEVLAASPRSVATRTLARVLVALPAALAVWTVALILVGTRGVQVPLAGATLEALAVTLVGLAVAAGLRAWRGLLVPSHVASVGLVVLVVLGWFLPRWYALNQTQTWGPPWEAAQIRWAAVAIATAAVLSAALVDPCRHTRAARAHTLKRNSTTSPSAIT